MKASGRTAAVLAVLWMAAVVPGVWAQVAGPAGPQPPRPDQEEMQQQARHAEQLEAEARHLMEQADARRTAGEVAEPQAAEMRRVAQVKMQEAQALRERLAWQRPRGTTVFRPPFSEAALHVVVMPTKSMEEAEVAELEEDLGVMSRVLEKALRSAAGGDPMPMPGGGMFAPLLDGQQPQGLYLAGYGAVFITSVRFPLTGIEEPREGKPAEAPRSLWDETKREMEGTRREATAVLTTTVRSTAVFRSVGTTRVDGPDAVTFEVGEPTLEAPPSPWPPYDPGRVEQLKAALFETLREASHIRHMAEADAVTVVVRGTPSPEVAAVARSADSLAITPESAAVAFRRALAGPALTVQVRKADIGAFAAGKLTFEEFRKRATVAIR